MKGLPGGKYKLQLWPNRSDGKSVAQHPALAMLNVVKAPEVYNLEPSLGWGELILKSASPAA